ncbi:Bifunctional lysine-specific demethylase and histidyl-hydroxylase NO66 [Armadillidium nasatum]|uniref:Bifunctional lysine-specific demethylase and histidyl-hydroxylase n=1 Tax=Armadillidium nasatum TaxID=96803 RepID=A0A5N5T1V1_9CRUS|nr:Bifunctional lysine-specific demethylase and histidyl-hydroxylase NO66 [Armadillidium nasatum]
MVQIKSSAPVPVLSARSVYNLVEGDIKRPTRDFQLPIKETLVRKKVYDNNKKLKKRVKRLNRKAKKNSIQAKTVQGKILIKMEGNVKPKKKEANKKGKTTVHKSEIEGNSYNGKNIKEINGESRNKEDQLKPSMDLIQSDNSSPANLNTKTNSVDEYKYLEIFEKQYDPMALQILERIEGTKHISRKGLKKANRKKVQKTFTNSSRKDFENEPETIKRKYNSMPMLQHDDDVKHFDLEAKNSTSEIENEVTSDKSSTKDSKKVLANGKTKKEKVSVLKSMKKTLTKTKRNPGESMHENESNSQSVEKTAEKKRKKRKLEVTSDKNSTKDAKKVLANGKTKKEKVSVLKNDPQSVEKIAEKKTKKRKLEDSLKERKIKKKSEVSKPSVCLVSSENELLNKFLTSDSYEVEDSQILGESVFASIISPLTTKLFMNYYLEKKHLLIKAKDKNRFKSILTTEDIDNILRKNNLSYTKNIDITSYVEGKRDTHNPEGRALASVVWDYYNSGCSIRMLNPQTFSNSVWKLLTTLQEFFNSFCGANVYLTPPGTQGFAPHWDDIEAFILQLEGKKRWKVYKWRSEEETLPRDSSGNFGLEDQLGELLLDCILEPGDMLYFPRGYIHQAEALDDIHSLHITISTYQKNAWVDLLEKVVELVNKMMEDDAPLDAAIDQMAKGSVYDALPPYLTESEEERTIFEGGERWSGDSEGVVNRSELTPETPIRLLRRGCVRLLVENDSVRLFHSLENSREYHEEEPKFIEISPEIAPGIEKLLHSYPKYITIEDLPLDSLEDKMILATGLWEKGIIISEHELDPSDIEEEDSISQQIPV